MKHKPYSRLALLLSLVLTCLSSCSPNQVRYANRPSSGPIVVLGDSLGAGYGIEKGKGFVDLLEERLKIKITNISTPGLTTEEAKPQLESKVLALNPSLVIIELGGNDALQKLDPKLTKANLAVMIEEVQKKKIPVLLLGVRGGLTDDPLASVFQDLAKQYKTGYVSDILEGVLTRPNLKIDSIHPNALGHQRLADRVEPELKMILKEQQKAQ